MIRRASPVRFDRPTENGRTQPLRVTILTEDGEEFDVILKLSSGRECSVEGLANEMLGALLAADLGLPINETFLVEIDPMFIDSIQQPEIRARFASSSTVAFASRNAGRQWRRWGPTDKLTATQHEMALRIMAFDAFIGNSDRSPGNSNLLVKDDKWRLIDHEGAFGFRMKLFPKCEPWVLGNLNLMRQAGQPSEHVFARQLSKQTALQYDIVERTWTDLSDVRFTQYDACLPAEWDFIRPNLVEAILHLKRVRDNVASCIEELRRVLS